jgi:hypothetical protein
MGVILEEGKQASVEGANLMGDLVDAWSWRPIGCADYP